jgi:hypothetical protein
MIWVSILKRKPIKEGYYYWKGKSGYGGMAYYNPEINEGNNSEGFEFDNSVPANKVDEDYLYWLDETNAKYEERQ